MTEVTQATPITTVGWERNEKNNLIPKIVNYFYIYSCNYLSTALFMYASENRSLL